MSKNVIEFSIRGTAKGAVSAMKKTAVAMKKMSDATVKVAKVTAIAAAATVGFVAVMASGIDKTTKFSQRIGVSIEQLSKYQFVAGQAGITMEAFNMSVQRMTRRVAEAAQGMGEAQTALRELGIDAKTFKNIGLDKQMQLLADKMENVQDPADKLRLAFKLFDSEGTSMLQMLNNGSESMRKLAKDAQFLGVVIGQQASANAAKFKDSMDRAGKSLLGVGRGISNELMPVLSGLANRFAKSLAKNRENITKFVADGIKKIFVLAEFIRRFGVGIVKTFTSVEGFKNFLSNLKTFGGNVATSMLFVGRFIAIGIWEGIKLSSDLILRFGAWVVHSLAAVVTGGNATSLSDNLAFIFARGIGKAKVIMLSELGLMQEGVTEFATQTAGNLTDAFNIDLTGIEQSAEENMTRLAEFGEILKQNVDDVAVSVTTVMDELRERGITWREELEENSKAFAESFFNIMSTSIQSLSDGLATAIIAGTSLTKVFEQVAKQMVTSLISGLIKMGIQRLLLATIFSGASKTEGVSEQSRAMGAVYSNAFAATAAIPIIGPALAPGVAAASLAAASAGAVGAMAVGAGLGGVAHGGLTNNPMETTFLVRKDERILSPNQNADLTEFLANQGQSSGGGDLTIENLTVHVMENVTNAEAILDLSDEEAEEFVAGPIIKALDALNRKGVRPDSAEGD